MIEVVNDLSANVARRERLSPSVPLDGEHPSASIVYSDEAYDAFVERLIGSKGFCGTQVSDYGTTPTVEHHVVWFEIAMDEIDVMKRGDRIGGKSDNVYKFVC